MFFWFFLIIFRLNSTTRFIVAVVKPGFAMHTRIKTTTHTNKYTREREKHGYANKNIDTYIKRRQKEKK